ncbi:PREDICTED: C-type lectin domain family 2 member B-like [Calidris pugnax]|uniref:C-type lectin domain family 2 member B-like n=1 Tax=Calidris pugnax TaxID=198806 RepID=UPI00071CC34A|nr:PREDICTED: C-type lectin domain family 2 member B-like [Calidris pugnax]
MAEEPSSVPEALQQLGACHNLEMKAEVRVAFQVTMVVLFMALLVTAVTFAAQAFHPRPAPCFRCPFDWIGYRGKCYYFSEVEGNWTSGQDNCSALGASLAMLDSLEDLSFVRRYQGTSEHWIGLSRGDEDQPWKWVNNSHFSQPFWIHGGGLCVYVTEDGLGSSSCDARRSWVCNKAESRNPGQNRTRRAQNLCVGS